MKYISTRGGDQAENFKEVVLKGLANDGGLFVPETYPKVKNLKKLKGLPYHELAFEIMSPYIGRSIPKEDLQKILREVYSPKVFKDKAIAPVKKLYKNEYFLELFHGPTLAFKDFALQFLGRVFDYFGERMNILGATSGDTGSAAIAGCAGRKNVNIFILHPYKRVSEVQRRQMTTILSKNVFNIALEGSFDDCQNIVKEIMGDIKFKQKYKLSAVNSINWARIVAQVVYYFYAALQFDEPASFSVPTGNFGDILAGWIALQMGCPIKKLIIATNKNDILHRFLETGTYSKKAVHQTLSPSMDIQISSNFERLLFEYHGRNPEIIQKKIKDLAKKGEFSVSKKVLSDIKKVFGSEKIDDIQTLATIAHVYKDTKELLDPHSAIGFMAGRDNLDDEPMISLATAHPAKFPDAVKRACGKTASLPDFLEDLFDRKEKYVVLPNSKQAILEAIIKNN